MSVKSLIIKEVAIKYAHLYPEYIANVFWSQGIAKVSALTFISYLKNFELYYVVYINIAEWCDTEVAYNFIQRLINPEREARLVYSEDNWWPVEINTENISDKINDIGVYSVNVELNRFENDDYDDSTAPCTEVDDDDYICSEEGWSEFIEKRPIKGLRNDYYTVEEAFGHLWLLNEQWNHVSSSFKRDEIEQELLHFENELRIHQAVNQSDNVTQRTVPLGMVNAGDIIPFQFLHGEPPKREVAGEWYNDIDFSVLDTLSNNSRREITLN